MKNIFFIVTMLVSIFTFSQEIEVKTEIKNLIAKSSTSESITKTDQLIEANLQKIDPAVLAEYYFQKGNLLFSQGKVLEGANSFALVNQYDGKLNFSIKNKDTKEKSYFYNKADAEKKIAIGNFSSIKESEPAYKFTDQIKPLVISQVDLYTKAGQQAINEKQFEKGGKDLETAYLLNKAMGIDNKFLLYYSGLMYLSNKSYDKSTPKFEQLITDKFNGVNKIYKLVNKKDNKESIVSENEYELLKKSPDYIASINETQSIENELYENAYISNEFGGNIDRAIELGKILLSKNQSNAEIFKKVTDIFLRNERYQDYLEMSKEMLAADPMNDSNLSNLGLVYNKMGKNKEAKEAFDKAITVNPNNAAHYKNISSIILEEDKDISKQLRDLGTSKVDLAKEKTLIERKKIIYKESIPYLEKSYAIEKSDSVKNILYRVYYFLGDNANAAKYK